MQMDDAIASARHAGIKPTTIELGAVKFDTWREFMMAEFPEAFADGKTLATSEYGDLTVTLSATPGITVRGSS